MAIYLHAEFLPEIFWEEIAEAMVIICSNCLKMIRWVLKVQQDGAAIYNYKNAFRVMLSVKAHPELKMN